MWHDKYSRLMGASETGTLSALKTRRQDPIDAAIAAARSVSASPR